MKTGRTHMALTITQNNEKKTTNLIKKSISSRRDKVLSINFRFTTAFIVE